MQSITSFITAISMIVSLSGISSIRVFTPVFLYMLLIRHDSNVEFLANGIAKLQGLTPSWMNNDLIFIIKSVPESD